MAGEVNFPGWGAYFNDFAKYELSMSGETEAASANPLVKQWTQLLVDYVAAFNNYQACPEPRPAQTQALHKARIALLTEANQLFLAQYRDSGHKAAWQVFTGLVNAYRVVEPLLVLQERLANPSLDSETRQLVIRVLLKNKNIAEMDLADLLGEEDKQLLQTELGRLERESTLASLAIWQEAQKTGLIETSQYQRLSSLQEKRGALYALCEILGVAPLENEPLQADFLFSETPLAAQVRQVIAKTDECSPDQQKIIADLAVELTLLKDDNLDNSSSGYIDSLLAGEMLQLVGELAENQGLSQEAIQLLALKQALPKLTDEEYSLLMEGLLAQQTPEAIDDVIARDRFAYHAMQIYTDTLAAEEKTNICYESDYEIWIKAGVTLKLITPRDPLPDEAPLFVSGLGEQCLAFNQDTLVLNGEPQLLEASIGDGSQKIVPGAVDKLYFDRPVNPANVSVEIVSENGERLLPNVEWQDDYYTATVVMPAALKPQTTYRLNILDQQRVVSSLGFTTAPPTKLPSDSQGKITHLALQFGGDIAVLETYRDLFSQMEPDVRFTIVVRNDAERDLLLRYLDHWRVTDQSRFTFIKIDQTTTWARDNMMPLVTPDKKVYLNAPYTNPHQRDQRVPEVIAHLRSDDQIETLANRPIAIEGGNIVPGEDFVFIGYDSLVPLLGLMPESELVAVMERTYGKRVIVVGREGQLVFHIDMAVTPIGNGVILVADPRLGVELAKQIPKKKDGTYARLMPFNSQSEFRGMVNRFVEQNRQTETTEKFDLLARQLSRLGFTVVRTPYLGKGMGSRDDLFITYNNVLMENYTGPNGQVVKRVYMPVYGIEELDGAAEKIYRAQGFEVVRISAAAISRGLGTVRCVTQVLERE